MAISFYKEEIDQKSGNQKYPHLSFSSISGEWGEKGIPNLARRSLIKGYWMLRNTRVTAFTVSKWLRKNQQRWGEGEGVIYPPSPAQLQLYQKETLTNQQRCSTGNLRKFLLTPCLKNICERLFLDLQ